MERDAVRGKDSFVTFDEVLQLARTHNVRGQTTLSFSPSPYMLLFTQKLLCI